jgi:hypothetical protein
MTTTTTGIEIPDYVTMVTPAPQRDIRDLASHLAGLLADNADLPAPEYFSISAAGQEVRLQFGRTRDTFRALALWAERFGGTVLGSPFTHDDGRESVHCEVEFTDHGIQVKAYAFVNAAA